LTTDARSWLEFIVVVLGYFFLREAYALARRSDRRFTLSTYIRQLEMAIGKTGGRTIAGVILSTLFVYLIGHLVLWIW
jgi:hypothetical protein